MTERKGDRDGDARMDSAGGDSRQAGDGADRGRRAVPDSGNPPSHRSTPADADGHGPPEGTAGEPRVYVVERAGARFGAGEPARRGLGPAVEPTGAVQGAGPGEQEAGPGYAAGGAGLGAIEGEECPKCGGPMLKRFNSTTGEPYLGCQRGYNVCRGRKPWIEPPKPEQPRESATDEITSVIREGFAELAAAVRKLKPKEPAEPLLPMPEHISTILMKWWASPRANVPRADRLKGIVDLAEGR